MKLVNFKLIGHDCPLGIYPSPVVPVGRCNGKLMASYQRKDEPTFVEIDEKSEFVKHGKYTQKKLKNFDPYKNGLLGLSKNNVISYKLDNEANFFSELLEDENFSAKNPFLRLSIAKDTESIEIIKREFLKSLNAFPKNQERNVDLWYKNQLRDIMGLDIVDEKSSIPSSWKDLLSDLKEDATFNNQTSYVTYRHEVERILSAQQKIMNYFSISMKEIESWIEDLETSNKSKLVKEIKTARKLKIKAVELENLLSSESEAAERSIGKVIASSKEVKEVKVRTIRTFKAHKKTVAAFRHFANDLTTLTLALLNERLRIKEAEEILSDNQS